MLNKPEIKAFYKVKLSDHGASAEGVGWKDSAAQEIRFIQLLKLIESDANFSINDLGCGIGDIIPMLNSRFSNFQYRGYDSLDEMVSSAKQKFKESSNLRFKTLADYAELIPGDYTIASGIFNVRNTIGDEEWMTYIIDTITAMSNVSNKGFAFNALTKYSDSDKMRPDLFYSDPLFLFDYCKKNFSRNVALLHDYGIYDFTILVKKAY